MKTPVYISGYGAVTPAGLNARQTLAAIRASLSAFEEILLREPFGAAQVAARIPTHWRLRRTEADWLVHMASRAIGEAMRDSPVPAAATALLIAPPEAFRNHPAYDDIPTRDFLDAVIDASGADFNSSSRAVDGGAAAIAALIPYARQLLQEQRVDQVLLGGVDSLVNDVDLARLGAMKRLKGDENPQGLVPGEGAAFVRLTRQPGGGHAVGIYGVGGGREEDSVLTDRYSQGRAILGALKAATSGPGPGERDIAFVISNSNGERYSGMEQLIARTRFYRTRREKLVIAYPAMTVGDLGAASAALSLIVAADSFGNGYAPGPIAMCEFASEEGLRTAAVVAAFATR